MARSQNEGAHRLPNARSWQNSFHFDFTICELFEDPIFNGIKTLGDGANQKSPVF
jgi:hypothetical protein